MSKHSKKAAAFTRMAGTIDLINIVLYNFLKKIDSGPLTDAKKEEIMGMSFLVRREIYNPMEKFHWDPVTPMVMVSMSSQNVSLQMALEEISDKLDQISSFCDDDLNMVVQSILDKGVSYQNFKNSPSLMKS